MIEFPNLCYSVFCALCKLNKQSDFDSKLKHSVIGQTIITFLLVDLKLLTQSKSIIMLYFKYEK